MATLNRADTRMKLAGSDDDVLFVMEEHKDDLDKEKIYYYYMPSSTWKSGERAEPMMKELYEIARKRLGKDSVPGLYRLNGEPYIGNYGQASSTTNNPTVSFDIFFNSSTNDVNPVEAKRLNLMIPLLRKSNLIG
ncbi:hypothetical protein AVEN_244024-1 [Araneus ventricosus]|uniref:Uncharacterized protein n=1 Tax=Araneus ventricosus TaxID=182803 RepID=A0A4Y2U717_ARAVE|nr:hypothetical protein AVEN_244024-1 [Araneus ventricosus]